MKTLQFLSYFILILLLFLSCETEKNNMVIKSLSIPNEKNEVVFILDNKMNEVPISVFKNRNFVLSENIHLFSKKASDTIKIVVKDYEKLYLATKFKSRDTLLLRKGDSVFVKLSDSVLDFTIKKSIPYFIPKLNLGLLKIKSKIDSLSQTFYTLNYKNPLMLAQTKYEYPAPLIPLNINRSAFKNNKIQLKKLVDSKIDNFNRVSNYYDSISKSGNMEIGLKKILIEDLQQKLFLDFNLYYNFSKDDYIYNIITSPLFINDSLINNRNEFSFLNNYIQRIVLKDKKSFSKSKVYIDYKKAFNNLPNYLKDPLLEKALIICVEQMPIQGETFDDIIKYFENYKQIYKDTVFINKFEANNLLKFKKIKNISSKIEMIDLKKNKIDLESLIKSQKGKLIYIDFWASWCAPCRAAMPYSKKLKDNYKDKDVSFIYVSIDKSFKAWEKASKEESLAMNNYISLDYPNNNFYKDLKLNTIPRYLLYDKNGKLIHPNAPGPKGDEIRKLFEKHLSN